MKELITAVLLSLSIYVSSQDFKYQGTYSFGLNPEEGATGIIYIHPNSDSTSLFYLDLNRGAPSYNSGALIGQMEIIGPGLAKFSMLKEESYINCSMKFRFTGDSLFIETIDDGYSCGYGFGVYSDGDFKLINKKIPKFYINSRGKKTKFKNLDWKEWWDF